MHASVGKLISSIYWHTQSYIEKKLDDYSIGIGEIPILMKLSRKGSINQKDLTKELHINKATTSREIKKLIAKGYVKRRRDKKDKRNYIISLTEKGKKVIPIIKKVLKEWRGKLLKGFSRDERKFILNALERVIENAILAKEELNGRNRRS